MFTAPAQAAGDPAASAVRLGGVALAALPTLHLPVSTTANIVAAGLGALVAHERRRVLVGPKISGYNRRAEPEDMERGGMRELGGRPGGVPASSVVI
ncbi:hypothetical protein [Rhodococcus sp. B10]|uniref:hypothetical protein n=1 Tax=Rhodococcus sp. B10 TaxID=2695876 RepID=UPI00168EEBE1|nr:hypothetical protein [Rhodococcus sp. B10]NIL76134.1 hypothetical protein [Rhodococcus sp. B10]